MRRRLKTPEEAAWLREHYPVLRNREMLTLFRERFGWAPSEGSIAHWGKSNGLRKETQPQYRRGNMPSTHRPVGSERVCADGYVKVKVSDERRGNPEDNWVLKHRLVWEREHGRVLGDGECVLFADGDRRNFEPGNLVAVTTAELGTLNRLGLTYSDAESLEECLCIARLLLGIGAARRRLAEGRGRP